MRAELDFLTANTPGFNGTEWLRRHGFDLDRNVSMTWNPETGDAVYTQDEPAEDYIVIDDLAPAVRRTVHAFVRAVREADAVAPIDSVEVRFNRAPAFEPEGEPASFGMIRRALADIRARIAAQAAAQNEADDERSYGSGDMIEGLAPATLETVEPEVSPEERRREVALDNACRVAGDAISALPYAVEAGMIERHARIGADDIVDLAATFEDYLENGKRDTVGEFARKADMAGVSVHPRLLALGDLRKAASY